MSLSERLVHVQEAILILKRMKAPPEEEQHTLELIAHFERKAELLARWIRSTDYRGAQIMTDDVPTPDEIINSTYKPKAKPEHVGPPPAKPQIPRHEVKAAIVDGKPVQLDEEQTKAIDMILSGMTFVIVGVKPTYGDPDDQTLATGSDFFTAARGDTEALRAAGPYLPGVFERLYAKRGWV